MRPSAGRRTTSTNASKPTAWRSSTTIAASALGSKFKDADLVGIPVRIVVGKRGLKEGQVELSLRRDREKVMAPVADAVAKIRELLDRA